MTTIEPLAPDDFEIVSAWLRNPEINRWLGSQWRTGNASSRIIAMAVRDKRNRLSLVRWEGRPCGLVGMSDLDPEDGLGMIWYLLGESDLGSRGIVTAAIRQVVRREIEEHGLTCIYAWVSDGNSASVRVLKKCGFREAGRFRHAARVGGETVDRLLFDFTRDDLVNLDPD